MMYWLVLFGLFIIAMCSHAVRLRIRYFVSYSLYACVMIFGCIFYTIKFALTGLGPRYENSW